MAPPMMAPYYVVENLETGHSYDVTQNAWVRGKKFNLVSIDQEVLVATPSPDDKFVHYKPGPHLLYTFSIRLKAGSLISRILKWWYS